MPRRARGGAVLHPGIGRVRRLPRKLDHQPFCVRRVEETGFPRPERRPGIAVAVHRAQHDHRQKRVEFPVLLDQVVAQNAPTDLFHARVHTQPLLQGDFATVPG